MSAPKLYTAPLPGCCALPAHSVNGNGTAQCLHCRATFSFSNQAEEWSKNPDKAEKPEKPKEPKKPA